MRFEVFDALNDVATLLADTVQKERAASPLGVVTRSLLCRRVILQRLAVHNRPTMLLCFRGSSAAGQQQCWSHDLQ
nr:MAG TPA: hypothetical protein [Caudoviricetes sp.]